MLLTIDDDKTVGDLQDRFAECFSGLKIEFYDTRHKWQEATADNHLLQGDTRLGDIRKNHNSNVFEIKSTCKTGKVEQDFRHLYGLYVQIFYRLGGAWCQTVATDDLTLGQLVEICNKTKQAGE